MNATETKTDFLEDLFEQHAKCESRTHDNGKVICSQDAAYRLHSCTPTINVCTAMGEDSLNALGTWEFACEECDRDLEECWTIRPI